MGLLANERGLARVLLDESAEIRYLSRVNHEASRRKAADLIRQWASRGRYGFSTEEVAQELSVSVTAARSALRRLKKKGLVATPYRGFHVFVPPEYGDLRCLPAEQFLPLVMEWLDECYYAGLLTAARYHGAAHHQPQIFQAVVPKNRPPIRCGRLEVEFVARHNAAGVPTARINTPRGYLLVSTPEATAFDLVGYAKHCGGLENVATVLAELGEALDPDRLTRIGELSPLPWAQRLGFLLERVGFSSKTGPLASFVAERVKGAAALAPGTDGEAGRRDPRWKLLVNVSIDADL